MQNSTQQTEPVIPKPTPQPKTKPTQPPVNSEADYTKLRDFLKQQKWQEANQETGEIMLQILSKEKEGFIKPEDIDILPCDDLRTIDQLWVQASSGHFGFSVQKQIWKDVGGNLEENNYEIYKKFGEIVGWYDRNRDHWKWSEHLTFSLHYAQKGHLPRLKFKMVLNTTLLSQLTMSIFSRCETCFSGEVELKSQRGVDYTKLRDLLKQKKWKEADHETYEVMLQAAGRRREQAGSLRLEDIAFV